jgi:2-polyprenyl-6-methoxyphenol hydroxylase-like FAD-dependent oxidoreductase
VTNWGEFPDNVLRQTYHGTKRMVGLLPSGRIDGGDGRQISIFWSLRLEDVPLWEEQGLDYWKEDAARLMPSIEPLLAQIESEDQVTIASYFDVRTWSSVKDRCVVIGDAAHASSPQLGQGASLALLDAMMLAHCLEQEPNVMAALVRYRDARVRQTRFYQLASKWMTPFFQSGHSYLAWPRDLLLGPLCRLPWLQREMVATMSGLKSGPFNRIQEQEPVMALGMKLAFGSLIRDEPMTTDLVRY